MKRMLFYLHYPPPSRKSLHSGLCKHTHLHRRTASMYQNRQRLVLRRLGGREVKWPVLCSHRLDKPICTETDPASINSQGLIPNQWLAVKSSSVKSPWEQFLDLNHLCSCKLELISAFSDCKTNITRELQMPAYLDRCANKNIQPEHFY